MPRYYNIPDWFDETYAEKMDEVLALLPGALLPLHTDIEVLEFLHNPDNEIDAFLFGTPYQCLPDSKIQWEGSDRNVIPKVFSDCPAWILRHLLPEAIRLATFLPDKGLSFAQDSDLPEELVRALTPSALWSRLDDLEKLLTQRDRLVVIAFLELMALRVGTMEGEDAQSALDHFWRKCHDETGQAETEK
jgi:hypothetical protein